MDARVTEFGAADAKARFSELLARAEQGEEIAIRKHGRIVAKLTPAKPAYSPLEARKNWDAWFAYRRTRKIALAPGETVMNLLTDTRGE
jgi:prevent-host-death family protein